MQMAILVRGGVRLAVRSILPVGISLQVLARASAGRLWASLEKHRTIFMVFHRDDHAAGFAYAGPG